MADGRLAIAKTTDAPGFPDRHVHISPSLGYTIVDGVLPAHLAAVRGAAQTRDASRVALTEALLDAILEARRALYSFAEIGEAMGCTHQNVMQFLDRGLKRRQEASVGASGGSVDAEPHRDAHRGDSDDQPG